MAKKKKKEVETGRILGRLNDDGSITPFIQKQQEEDIAPVRNDNKWFKNGIDTSGYDIQNPLDAINRFNASVLMTGVDIIGQVGLGVTKPIEGVGDFAQNRVADVLDFFGGDKTAEKIRKSAAKEWGINRELEQSLARDNDRGIDDMSFLGAKGKSIPQGVGSVLLAMGSGGLGGAIGGTNAAASVASLGIMGVGSAGNAEQEALEQGATRGEARLYGILSGASETLSEMMFGGLSKGSQVLGIGTGMLDSADDALINSLTKKINNRLVRTFTQAGLKATSEGIEEVVSGLGSAWAKKLTYMKEEDIKKLIEDENLLDSFLSGTLSAAVSQAPNVAQNITTRQDGKLRLQSNNEIRDFITNLNEQEQQVVEREIENRLGQEEKVTKKRRIEIEKQVIEDLDRGYINANTIRDVLGENYNAERDVRLNESFNEETRRTQAYENDLSKYDEKQRATIQRAIDSGLLNNSNKTHDFVDLIAKISADKGVDFDFTNNERIKDTGFGIQGKTVNGYVQDGKVTLNLESNQALNKTVGHEITHVLEGSEVYQELQNSLKSYLGEREWNNRIKDLSETYKNVENANVENELTADLVGDYIFNDEAFVRNLSTRNQNLFQKIYDEIKYLVKVATAGSKEARELEKAKRVFEKAYRENVKTTKEGTQYSVKESKKMLENQFKELTGDSMLVADAKLGNYAFQQIQGREVEAPYSKEAMDLYEKIQNSKQTSSHLYHSTPVDRIQSILQNGLQVGSEQNQTGVSSTDKLYLSATEELANSFTPDDSVTLRISPNANLENLDYDLLGGEGSYTITNNIDPKYLQVKENGKWVNLLKSQYAKQDVKYSLTTDNQGRQLSEQQQEYFKDSKVRDKNGQLIEVYHGSSNAFTVFDKGKMKTGATMYASSGDGFYFTDSEAKADKYSKGGTKYSTYLNITNPFVVENKISNEAADLLYKFSQQVIENHPEATQKDIGAYELFDRNDIGLRSGTAILSNVVSEYGNEFTEFLKENGYDGIKSSVTDYDNLGEQYNYVAFESNQIKNVDNTKPTSNPDIRYSLSDNAIQDKINQSMTMEEAKDLVQRTFVLNGLKDWYDGKYQNGDEWLAGEGADEVELYAENTELIQNKFLNKLYDKDNGFQDDYYISDILNSYQDGTLTGEVKQDIGKVDTSVDTNYQDSRFYSPSYIEATQELYDKANQRVTNKNRQEVYKARADFIIAAHNEGVTERLGLTQQEINAKLKSWANYTPKAMELSKSVNEGVSPQNRWTGIENSSIVNSISISNEDMSKMVKKIIGDSNGWQRQYITGTMLALDTHIDYTNLTFDFEQNQQLREKNAAGDYDSKTDVIRIGDGYQNTVAHEMGHYIDYMWGEELFGRKDTLSSLAKSYDKTIFTQEQLQFIEHFNEFQESIEKSAEMGDTLKYGSSRNASYWQKPTEAFARFVGKFTEWTRNQATNNRYGYEEKFYNDRFTESQYKEFIKILQEKSALDTTTEKKYGLFNKEKIKAIDSLTQEQKQQVSDIINNEENIPSYQVTEQLIDVIGKDNYYAIGKTKLNDLVNKNFYEENAQFSLSNQNNIAPTSGWNVRSEDVRLQSAFKDAIAPLQEQVQELTKTIQNIAPSRALTEEEANEYATQTQEAFNNEVAPIRENLTPEENQRMDMLELLERNNMMNDERRYEKEQLENKINPVYPTEEATPGKALSDIRDIDEVGKRGVKAYQYEHPEVKPYFQEEARGMLNDLNNSIKGERFINESQQRGQGTSYDVIGVKRFTSPEIAELLDSKYGYTYNDIRKGLNAIIEDHGAENIAIAKRIELVLDDNLRNGYTDWQTGTEIPPNQDYLNMLAEQEWQNYFDDINSQYPLDVNQVQYALEQERQQEEQYRIEKSLEEMTADDINLEPFLSGLQGASERQAERQQLREELNQKREIKIPKQSDGRKAWNRFKSLVSNEFAVVDDYSKRTGNKDIKFKADTYNNYQAIAQSNIETAQTDINGKAIGRSGNSIFEEAKRSNVDEVLDTYLKHWSNIDRSKQGKGGNYDAKDSYRIVKDIEANYPKVKSLAKDLWQYYRNARHNLRDAGIISQEVSDMLGRMYPHYNPYISENIENYFTNEGKLKPKSTIKRAKGGATLEGLLSAEEAMQRYTKSEFNTIFGNDLYREIVNTSNDIVQLGGDDRTSYVNADNLYADKDGYYLTAYENGEPITAKISEDLYRTLTRESRNRINDIENTFSMVTKPLQAVSNVRRNILTSWSPTFIAKNFIKDFQEGIFNSKYTKDFIKNYPTAFKELASNTELAQQFKSLYGSGLTMGQYDIDANNYNPSGKNRNFLKGIKNVNELIELAPRFAEFKASIEHGASLQEAMYNAREVTTNFSRGGTLTKALNRNGFTFLNSSIQGFDKFIRNFSGENGAKGIVNSLAKAAIFGIAPAVFNELAFGSGDDKDEDYEALPDYIKDNYYIIKNSDGNFIRIPKGRVLSVFGSAARRTIEAIEGEENAFEGYWNNVQQQIGINNPEENNIFAPLLQAMGGRKLDSGQTAGEAWYGGDIIPSRLQKERPEDQYDASIDKLSIWLGQHTGISPYKINYVLDQYTGGIGDLAIPMMTEEANSDGSIIAPIKDQFTADTITDNKYVSEFYDTKGKLYTGSKATDEDILKNKYMNSISTEMAKLYAERREVQADTSLTKQQKYAKSQAIKAEINRLAKEGMDNYNDIIMSNNYAKIGDTEYYKNANGQWTKVTDDVASLGLDTEEKSEYYKVKNDIYTTKKNNDGNDKPLVMQDIINSNLTPDAKVNLYTSNYKDDLIQPLVDSGMDVDSYLTYKSQNFTADKDSNGKSISGSKKQKVFDYINSMDVPYEQKLILAKSEYNSFNDNNYEIIEYVENTGMDYDERIQLYKALGFKVDGDSISW